MSKQDETEFFTAFKAEFSPKNKIHDSLQQVADKAAACFLNAAEEYCDATEYVQERLGYTIPDGFLREDIISGPDIRKIPAMWRWVAAQTRCPILQREYLIQCAGRTFRVDALLYRANAPQRGLVIEYDEPHHQRLRSQFEKDEFRDWALRKAGYRVFRATGVRDDVRQVVQFACCLLNLKPSASMLANLALRPQPEDFYFKGPIKPFAEKVGSFKPSHKFANEATHRLCLNSLNWAAP